MPGPIPPTFLVDLLLGLCSVINYARDIGTSSRSFAKGMYVRVASLKTPFAVNPEAPSSLEGRYFVFIVSFVRIS